MGATALLLAACGGSKSTVKGHINDQSGSQSQAMSAGAVSLGGSGTTSAATQVNAYSVGANGQLSLVANGSVSGGAYSLDVPENSAKLVVQAVDAQGAVLASAIVAKAGTRDAPATVEPMDSESSLEAQVLVEMTKQGLTVDQVNTVDLRARIDQELAASVQADAAAGGDEAQRVHALAVAIAAAQEAQIQAAAKASVTVTQSAFFNAELAAEQKLDAALDAGQSAATAYATFFADLAQAQTSLGLDAQAQNTSERDADASFRISIEAQVGGSADTSSGQAILDAAIRGSAALEARAAGAAVDALLSGASTAQGAKDASVSATTSLQSQVGAAANSAAAVNAFDTFAANVSGTSNLSASVLGQFIGVTGSNQTAVQVAVDASTTAAGTLVGALNTAFNAAVSAGSAIDFRTVAQQVVNAYGDFDNAVSAEAAGLDLIPGVDGATSAQLLLVANGSFQAAG